MPTHVKEIQELESRIKKLRQKIESYQRIRKWLNDNAKSFLGDVYALECLEALDKTLFNWIAYMAAGLNMLEKKYKQLMREAGGA
jgi:uncharacterized membrane protein YfhO